MAGALGGSFAFLLLIGLPVGLALALGSLFGLSIFSDIPLEIAAQRMVAGVRSFPLLAIPLYILAGGLMSASGITQRLVDFAAAIVGSMRGGLSQVTIVTTAIFGGISGSQVADTSSVGRLMIPQMISAGYSRPAAVSVMATAGALFVTIPPSITLIVYGVLAEVSISELFLWGLVIGVAFLVVLMATAYVIAIVKKHPAGQRMSLHESGRAFVRAIPSLSLPVIVLGGIRIGAFTPTEGGAIAVLCALVVGVFIHRELRIKELYRTIVEATVLVGVIMLVLAAAQLYAWALISGQVPQQITHVVLGLTDNPLLILLLINLLLLVIGTVIEGNAALIVFVPILLPVAVAVGIDPLHLGLIMVVNLGLGLLTPPVGTVLLVAVKLGRTTITAVIKEMLPWFTMALALLLAVTYLPIMAGWV